MKLNNQRQKITLATTFPVCPPRSGYATRIFHLYRHLANDFDIEIISLDHAKTQIFQEKIYPGLKEIRIPKTNKYQEAEKSLQKKARVPVTDVAMAEFYSLIPNYVDALRESTKEADLVITCHPYLLPVISQVSQKPLGYEALDLQSKLKRNIIANQDIRDEIVELTFNLEKKCCEISQLVIVPSTLMSHEITNQYNLAKDKVVIIPNGIELNQISSKSYEERISIKKELGFENHCIILFTTEGYLSVDQTTRLVLRMASKLKNFIFLIVGHTGLLIHPRLVAPNVSLIEEVDEVTSRVIQAVSDVAINPAQPGSYTDFKVLDFLSAGIPLISTPYGYRHLGLQHFEKSCYIAKDIWQFSEKLIEFKKDSSSLKKNYIDQNRKIISETFTWNSIVNTQLMKLRQFIQQIN